MRLQDICEINPRMPRIDDDTEVSFVPMTSVSEDGKIDTSDIRPYIDVKKGYTSFKEDDVLFAKITPCMENGKGAIARGLKNGYGCGSSEFHVLRTKGQVMPEWIYYLTSWSYFRREAEKHMTGSAGQRRVPKLYLENYEIRLPELSDQEYQVQTLTHIKEVIDYRKAELVAFEELTKARFVEMFIAKDFPLLTLDEVSLSKGEYGAQSASIRYDPSRPRYVRITDINDDGTLNNDVVSSANKEDDEQYKLTYGDFMFARMGATVGKTYAYKSGNQIFAGYLIRYKLDLGKIMPEYLYAYTKLDEYENWVLLNQSGAAQPGINAKKYGSLKIPVPPIEVQRQFVGFCTKIDKSKLLEARQAGFIAKIR